MTKTYFCIQSGDGGQDAKNFVYLLSRMYEKYMKKQGVRYSILSPCKGKEPDEVLFLIDASEKQEEVLKGEVGVHRLIRISPYDKKGRRPTSFAYVFFWQQEEIRVVIRTSDIRIDTFRAGGKGGQHVNVTDSAVRVVHIPTGITVSCQQEKSQAANN